MRGNNPIRPPVVGNGSALEVKHIFSTVQGEGFNAGQRAVFIRLGGCNLACDFCDTDFEVFNALPVTRIMETVDALSKGTIKLVVITGGEPFRQPIEKLCSQLLASGYKVQIETNGTLYRSLPEDIEIICSPKNTGQGYFPVRDDLLANVNALKFILSATHPLYSQVEEVGQGNRNIPVYLQPMDEYDPVKNRQNFYYAIALAMKHGYRLSLQTHKAAGLE